VEERVSEQRDGDGLERERSGVRLDDAIEALREQLASAHAKAAGADLQFPVESVTVELRVEVTRELGGKAGFRVPVVDLELGGSGSRRSVGEQTVTLVMAGPVDRDGVPQRAIWVTS
jgi:Trypsin-co-occurring domain 2